MVAPISAGGRVISAVDDPVDDQDAATKAYVDSHSGGGGGAFMYLQSPHVGSFLSGSVLAGDRVSGIESSDIRVVSPSGWVVDLTTTFFVHETIPGDGNIKHITAYVTAQTLDGTESFLVSKILGVIDDVDGLVGADYTFDFTGLDGSISGSDMTIDSGALKSTDGGTFYVHVGVFTTSGSGD